MEAVISSIISKLDSEVLITLVFFLASTFALLRYISKSNQRREEAMMTFTQKQAEQIQKIVDDQLEYHARKNGHMERMSKDFTDAVVNLTDRVATMHESIRHFTDAQRSVVEAQKHIATLTTSALNNNSQQLQRLYAKFSREKTPA